VRGFPADYNVAQKAAGVVSILASLSRMREDFAARNIGSASMNQIVGCKIRQPEIEHRYDLRRGLAAASLTTAR